MTAGSILQNTLVYKSGDTVVIEVTGSLDFTNCGALQDALDDACSCAQRLAVDMIAADFIDTAVLEYLARAASAMRQRGKNLEVVCLEGSHPLRVLRVSTVDSLLDLVIRPKPNKELCAQ
jgi:anti-anti-sigma factor